MLFRLWGLIYSQIILVLSLLLFKLVGVGLNRALNRLIPAEELPKITCVSLPRPHARVCHRWWSCQRSRGVCRPCCRIILYARIHGALLFRDKLGSFLSPIYDHLLAHLTESLVLRRFEDAIPLALVLRIVAIAHGL